MISIVISIYNEENIDNLYARLTVSAPSWNDDYEESC
jgi:hypothetical protein